MQERGKLKRHAKNSVFIAASRLVQMLTGLAAVMLLTRYLPVEDFGWFAYIFTLVTLVVNMTHFGVNQVMVREISRDRARASTYFGSAVLLRALTMLISFGVLKLAEPWLTIPPAYLTALYVCLAAELANAGVQLFACIFVSFEETVYDPLFTIMQNVLYLVLLFACILLKQGLAYVFAARALSLLVQFGLVFRVLGRKFVLPGFGGCLGPAFGMAKASLSLGVGCMLYQNVFFANTLFLKWLSGAAQVPFFQLANDLMLKLFIFPNSVLQAVFPELARNMHSDRGKALQLQQILVNYAVLLGVPVTLYLCFYSEELVRVFFGPKFAEAKLSLIILSFVFTPMVIDAMLNLAVLAINKQHYMIYYAGGALVYIVAANLIFVPHYGYTASCVIALSAYVLLACAVAMVSSKLGIKLNYLKVIGKCVACGGASYLIMLKLAEVSVWLPLPGGIVSYLLLALLLRTVPLRELGALLALARRRPPAPPSDCGCAA